jgi:hypothetical protein
MKSDREVTPVTLSRTNKTDMPQDGRKAMQSTVHSTVSASWHGFTFIAVSN